MSAIVAGLRLSIANVDPESIIIRRPNIHEQSDSVIAGAPSAIEPQGGALFLYACLLTLAVLLVKNMVADLGWMDSVKSSALRAFLKYKLFSNDGIATIMAASVGAYYLFKQITFQLRPHLTFTAKLKSSSEFADSALGTARYWIVDVANYGSGPALLQGVSYRLRLATDEVATPHRPYEEIRKLLCRELKEFHEFALYRFSPGAICPPNIPMRLFECKFESINKISQLDVVFWYRGFGGGVHAKRVVCIPEYWHATLVT